MGKRFISGFLASAGVVMCLVFIAGNARADRRLAVGVDLGIRDFTGNNMSGDLNAGPGADLYVQVGMTSVVAMKFDLLGSIHSGVGIQNAQSVTSSFFLGGVNMGLDFDLIPYAVIQPVIDIGIGGYRLGSDYNMSYGSQGSYDSNVVTWGADAGTGFDYFLDKSSSLGLRVTYIYMPVPAVVDGSTATLDGSSIFAGVNFAYHFDVPNDSPSMMHPGSMGMDGDR